MNNKIYHTHTEHKEYTLNQAQSIPISLLSDAKQNQSAPVMM